MQVLKEMNPMVKIDAIQGPVEALPIEVFKSFDVIVSSGISLDAQVSVFPRFVCDMTILYSQHTTYNI